MRLLVTGSDGLLGNALRSEVAEKNLDVFFATKRDADLRNPDQVKGLFDYVKPTHVVHTAALVGGIGGNLMYSGNFFRDNTMINLNVLESAREAGVERLVSFMSTCVFPDRADYPLTADQLHGGPPHPSNFGYAYAKRMLDVQSRAFRDQWGCEFQTLIPTNMYGPHDNFSLSEGHVLPALIHKAYAAKSRGEPLQVWGSGRPLREFIHAKDVAKLSLRVIQGEYFSEPLIVTSGEETSIQELVAEVVKAFDFQGVVRFDSTKPDGQYRKPSDNRPLNAMYGDFTFTSLTEGVKETVNWFIANFPEVRL